MDARKSFREAVKSFQEFAADEGRPIDLLWITQDRVHVVGGQVWVFRPEELNDPTYAREYYESIRGGDSSIKFLGVGVLGDRYACCLEKMPSPPHDPKQFYMSLHAQPGFPLRTTSSRVLWTLLRFFSMSSERNKFIADTISLDRTIPKA